MSAEEQELDVERASLASASLQEDAQRASDFLKALANPWRLRILCLLAEGPLAVGVLAERLDAREALISQHLMRLRAEDLVRGVRSGQSVTYSLTSGPAAELVAVAEIDPTAVRIASRVVVLIVLAVSIRLT